MFNGRLWFDEWVTSAKLYLTYRFNTCLFYCYSQLGVMTLTYSGGVCIKIRYAVVNSSYFRNRLFFKALLGGFLVDSFIFIL